MPPLDFSRVYMGDADTDLQAHDMLFLVRVSVLGSAFGSDWHCQTAEHWNTSLNQVPLYKEAQSERCTAKE